MSFWKLLCHDQFWSRNWTQLPVLPPYPTWRAASGTFCLSLTPLLLEGCVVSRALISLVVSFFFFFLTEYTKSKRVLCTWWCEQGNSQHIAFTLIGAWCVSIGMLQILLLRSCWTEKEPIWSPVEFWWSTCVVNRELPLQKGDIVYIYKQIDQNWYEGEHHGRVGIFPRSYIEVAAYPGGVLFAHSLFASDDFMSFFHATLLILFVHSSFSHQLRKLSPKSHYHCKYWNMETLLLSSTSMVILK